MKRHVLSLAAAFLLAMGASAQQQETGTASADVFGNAKWIGADDHKLPFYAHYLPVFRLLCEVNIDSRSPQGGAAILYGMNDWRLMGRWRNVLGVENGRNEAYVKVQLHADGTLNVYRAGYTATDRADAPLHTFRVPGDAFAKAQATGWHRVEIAANLGHTEFLVDGQRLGRVGLNPMGNGGDYIAFPVVGDLGFTAEKGCKARFRNVEVRNWRAPHNAVWRGGDVAVADGALRVVDTDFRSANCVGLPLLRSQFELNDKPIARADLYVSARGVYDLYLNGRRVADDYFCPGAMQYDKTQPYRHYDLTALLRQGRDNVLSVQLGEGWWMGGLSFVGDGWNQFGDRPSLLARLAVTYADGTTTGLETHPSTFLCSTDGPVRAGSFFQGEVYDATRHAVMDEAMAPCRDVSDAWREPVEIATDGTTHPGLFRDATPELREDTVGAVRAVRVLTARSVAEVRPGVFVYDMGQNMAGVPEIHLHGLRPGAELHLRFAEVLYPDLPQYARHKGELMLENIRAAMARDIYVARGGDEVLSPRFTYHGYRYVEITGLDRALPLADVRGLVLSSLDTLAADFTCSNERVNRLWQNIQWSTLANFLSIPTDCPQRNERMGWCGDISVYARTATYMADVRGFLHNYLRCMRDVQLPDGQFQDIAPFGGGFGGLLWGSAGVTVPWELYQHYADTLVLRDHIAAMERYMDFVRDNYFDPATGILVQRRAWGDLGDWLGLEDGKNDRTLLFECYYIYDLDIMARAERILGRPDKAAEYERRAQERRDFFVRTYVDAATGKTIASGYDKAERKGQALDLQTTYVLPLVFGVVQGELKDKLVRNLLGTLARENVTDDGTPCPPYSLMTGFIGTAWISKALSDNGQTSAAYRLLQQTAYPSWLYPVEQGATTVWERLNSYTKTDGFGRNNSMNSFNHYSFGAVGAWMMGYCLGIQRDERQPGFRHFLLRPEADPTGGMTFARGHYDSPHGRIESAWHATEGGTTYEFAIPQGCTASLRLPAASMRHVAANGQRLRRAGGVGAPVFADGHVEMELQPGRYRFDVRKP